MNFSTSGHYFEGSSSTNHQNQPDIGNNEAAEVSSSMLVQSPLISSNHSENSEEQVQQQDSFRNFDTEWGTWGAAPHAQLDLPVEEIVPVTMFNEKLFQRECVLKKPSKEQTHIDEFEICRVNVPNRNNLKFVELHIINHSILSQIETPKWKEAVSKFFQFSLRHADFKNEVTLLTGKLEEFRLSPAIEYPTPAALFDLMSNPLIMEEYEELCQIVNMSTTNNPLILADSLFAEWQERNREISYHRMYGMTKWNQTFTYPNADFFVHINDKGIPVGDYAEQRSWLRLVDRNRVTHENEIRRNHFGEQALLRMVRKLTEWEKKVLKKKDPNVNLENTWIGECSDTEVDNGYGLSTCPVELMDGGIDINEVIEECGAQFRWRSTSKRAEFLLHLDNLDHVEQAIMVLQYHEFTARKVGSPEVPHIAASYHRTAQPYEQRMKRTVRNILRSNGVDIRGIKFLQKNTVQPFSNEENIERVNMFMRRKYLQEIDELTAPNFPWSLWIDNTNQHEEISDREMIMQLQFHDVPMGVRWLYDLLRLSPFRFGPENHYNGVMEPYFRMTMRCSPNVRYALDKELRAWDLSLRKYDGDEVVYDTDSMHFGRLVDGSELIGVEGWPKLYVEDNFQLLKNMLKWEEIRIDDALFHGIGEEYVYYVVDLLHRKIAVELDKFERKCFIIGRAEAKSKAIVMFANWKTQVIRTNMELAEPRYFNSLGPLLKKDSNFAHLKKLVIDLSIKEDDVLWFEGSIEQFNGIVALLDELNQKLYDKIRKTSDGVADPHKLICPVCLCPIDADFYRMDACGHLLCRICVNNMIKASFNQSTPLKCCFEGCTAFFNSIDYKFLVLGGSRREKMFDSEKAKKLFTALNNLFLMENRQDFFACSTVDCSGVLRRGNNGVMKCGTCKHEKCRRCFRESHGGYSCATYSRMLEDDGFSISEYLETHKTETKRCPNRNCTAIIEKNGGCTHMRCNMCSHEFCWLCGAPFDYSNGHNCPMWIRAS